jgi:hypothetical protein
MLQALRASGEHSIFMADMEFKESKAVFHRLGVMSLPWVVHLGANLPVGQDGVIKFKHNDVVCPCHKAVQSGADAASLNLEMDCM